MVIKGYNFGANAAAVSSIYARDELCTSVEYISSKEIRCIFTQFPLPNTRLVNSSGFSETFSAITAGEITVNLRGGSNTGPYAEPQVILQSGSGRPVISAIDLTPVTLVPHAVEVYPKNLWFSNVLSAESQTGE